MNGEYWKVSAIRTRTYEPTWAGRVWDIYLAGYVMVSIVIFLLGEAGSRIAREGRVGAR